jgi:large subunit ribosomal protein L6
VSRIGKEPIPVPSGVEVRIEGPKVSVKGPKGELNSTFNEDMRITLEDGVLAVTRPSDSRGHRSLHGLTRTLLSNMVVGVSQGFTKNLEIVGVGYRAVLKDRDLEMALGFSHPVHVKAEEGIVSRGSTSSASAKWPARSEVGVRRSPTRARASGMRESMCVASSARRPSSGRAGACHTEKESKGSHG